MYSSGPVWPQYTTCSPPDMVWTGHMIVLICLHGVVLVSETYEFSKHLYRIPEMIVPSVQVGAPWKWRVSGPMTHVCSFMDRSASLVFSSVLTDLHLYLHLWYTNGCMMEGAKWHSHQNLATLPARQCPLCCTYLKFEPTTPTVADSQCWLHCRVLLSLLVCLV